MESSTYERLEVKGSYSLCVNAFKNEMVHVKTCLYTLAPVTNHAHVFIDRMDLAAVCQLAPALFS